MGLDSYKLIKGRIPDSSQTWPLWHTLTTHSLKFLLSARTEGVPAWRRGGGRGVSGRCILQQPGSLFMRRNTELCRSGGRGSEKRKRGETLATSRRRSGLRSCGRSPCSPLHPINGNSPHFLLWRFRLLGCLGPASAKTCAREGAHCSTQNTRGQPDRTRRCGIKPSVP